MNFINSFLGYMAILIVFPRAAFPLPLGGFLSRSNMIYSSVSAGRYKYRDTPNYRCIPFGIHILKLERYREDQHGPCARMTRKIVKRSTFFAKICIIKYSRRSSLQIYRKRFAVRSSSAPEKEFLLGWVVQSDLILILIRFNSRS